MFDTDGSGEIDCQEVGELMKGLGNQFIEESAIKEAIAEIDVDGDGQINFEEFMEMMKAAARNDANI